MYAAVRSFPAPNASAPDHQSSRKAAQLILCKSLISVARIFQRVGIRFKLRLLQSLKILQGVDSLTFCIVASQYENASSRTMATNLIHIQIMLLMAIEADNRDPRGHVGVSKSSWLGSAVGLAYSMKLHAQKVPLQQSENDSDSDESLARRVWLSLVIMDRLHAASQSCPLQIPDTSVVLYTEDQALLGENFYHLARKSVRKNFILMTDVFRSVHHSRPLHTDTYRPSRSHGSFCFVA